MFFFFVFSSFSVVQYKFAASELIISGEGKIDGDGVNSKGLEASVLKITINDGPTSIGDSSFVKCTNLKSIFISSTVNEIIGQPFTTLDFLSKIEVDPKNNYFSNDENFALYDKDKTLLIRAPCVKNLKLAKTLIDIRNNAFRITYFHFESITIPKSYKIIEENAFFAANFHIFSFESPAQITELKGFKYSTMNTITIPNTIQVIRAEAFSNCQIYNLFFEKESTLKEIEYEAFVNLRSLMTIELPDSLEKICDNAFRIASIQTIKIGAGCSNISLTAFKGCENLKEISVTQTNTYYSAKEGLLMNQNKTELLFFPPNLESLTIPESVQNIGGTILQNAMKLKVLTIDGTNSKWKTLEGVLYKSDFSELIAVCGGVTKVVAHADVVTIGDSAAFGCTNLAEFSFGGNKVKEILPFAFASSGLISFTLPDQVTKVCNNAFEKLPKMTTFTMNEDSLVETINYYCFHNAVFTSFKFGKNVKTIITGAFYACENLQEITFPVGSQLEKVGIYSFEFDPITVVELPATLKEFPERSFRFCEKLEKAVFDVNSNLSSIGQISFYGCTSLKEVILPDKCLTIGSQAFEKCYNLVSIIHKATVIGNGAFAECTSLQNFNFSAGQTSVNPGMFLKCSNLVEFNVDPLNSNIKSIDGCVYSINEEILKLFPPGKELATIAPKTVEFADNAFAWSTKLKFVAYYSGSNLTKIGMSCFYECTELRTVQFPSQLITLSSKCFYGCTSIKSIVLPSTIKTIQPGSFIGCTNLIVVKFCGSHELTGTGVFEKNTVIFVTDLYPSETFCSNKIARKLSYDCEFKKEFVKECQNKGKFVPLKAILAGLFIYND